MRNRSRNLSRLKEKVFNSPLLITENSLLPITSYLKNPDRTAYVPSGEVSELDKLLTEFDYSESMESYEEAQLIRLKERAGIDPETNVGTIEIIGTLVPKAGTVEGCVELVSYEKLKSTTKLQIALGAQSIVYIIESGGGSAYSAFTTARDLRKMADDAGVKTYSYVDGAACSAAYMMAAATHEIVSNEESDVGSIGVLIQLINNSKQLEKEGVERTFITAGDYKVPFNEDGSFQPEFIERLEKGVSKTYDKFVKTVSDLRGIPEDKIRATQARVYDAEESLALGLIDKIMEFEDFEKYVMSSLSRSTLNSGKTVSLKTEENMSKQTDVATPEQAANLDVITQQLADTSVLLQTKETELSDVLAEKATLTASLADLQKELKDAQEAKQSLADQIATIQADALQAERKAKLEVVLGTENDQVATLLASTQSLDETAFGAIVAAMQAKVDIEDKTMVEKGNSAKQDADIPTYQDRLKATAKAQQSK